MAGGGVGEAALAAEALGAAEVAGTAAGAGGFLEGMAGVSALEGAGVAGLGLGTGAGLTTGAGLAGGLGSLSPAFQTALAETAVTNPSIAAQFAQAANAGAVPTAASALGTGQLGSAGLQGLGAGQLGDLALTDASLGAAGQANAAQAASQISPAQAAFNRSLTASISPTTMTDVGSSGVEILPPREGLVPSADKYANLTSSSFGPSSAIPIQNPAFTPPVEGMLDAATGRIPETPGIMNLLSKGYDAWKDSNPFIKYGLPAMGAVRYLGKPTAAYSPPGYSGPLSKINISPNYRPYSYMPYAAGGPVEEMSRENAIGANTGYPQADIQQGAYATPWQTPVSRNVVAGESDANVDQMTGLERMADGGIASLGSYSDGGRLLKGPGDGMSDGIPATISGKQPARLADGEFVVPADVVSGIGNGSTDAGAKHLYSMMDKVRKARTGTKKQGREINPRKYLPA